MKQVKVKKSQLIDILKNNLENHIKEYNLAHELWVKTTIDLHKERIKNLKEFGKNIGENFGSEPVSQEKSYDRAIKMLEMSVDDEILLTEDEFSQYVMDQWAWSNHFKTITSSYIESRK